MYTSNLHISSEITDQFCTAKKQPDCQNGGYATVLGGKCKCVCPLGLDPKKKCTKLKTKKSKYPI